MCSGGGGGSYQAPKVDPAPTAVQSADTGVDTSASNKQRKKRGLSSNFLSNDRGSAATILGSAIGGGNADGGARKTLG